MCTALVFHLEFSSHPEPARRTHARNGTISRFGGGLPKGELTPPNLRYPVHVFVGNASRCSIASSGPIFNKKNLGSAPSDAPAGLAHCLRPQYFWKQLFFPSIGTPRTIIIPIGIPHGVPMGIPMGIPMGNPRVLCVVCYVLCVVCCV